MSEYLHVEKPFLDQFAALRWQVVDQGQRIIPVDPVKSLRTSFRKWLIQKEMKEIGSSLVMCIKGIWHASPRPLNAQYYT